MRKRRILNRVILPCIRVLYGVALVFSILVGALLKSDEKWIKINFPDWSASYDLVANTAAISLPIATVLVASMGWLSKLPPPTQTDKAIKRLLDDFRKRAFPPDDPEVMHRVTLFRHHPWHYRLLFRGILKWCGCLVPYERCGEFMLVSDTCFLAPKDTPDRCEGVAGQILKDRKNVYIPNLPDVTRTSSKKAKEKYAGATFQSLRRLEKRLKKGQRMNQPIQRSFWGTPVEIDGALWGVFLVDSRASVLPDSDLKETYRHLGACLQTLLSKK